MNASRLKTLVLIIWGGILVLGTGLTLWALTSSGVRASLGGGGFPPGSASQSGGGAPAPDTFPPTSTPTPPARIVYLPSATARPGTSTPITPTGTPITPLPIAQFFVTLSADYDPLTGLKPASSEILNRRPISVKITTFPRGVRAYQSGLTRADLVYEYYIEDGLTRFIAVFYGQDAERAGPVRSGRYFDEHIMRMYHAALVFANADERVETHLVESDLKSLLFVPRPDNCPPLCRDETIEGYNNVFVDTAGVGPKLTNNNRQSVRATLFGPVLYPLAEQKITRIYTHYSVYSYGYWEYDESHHLYWRFSDAQDASSLAVNEVYQPHIDNLTGAQVSAQNVVVLVVPHNFNNEFDRADQVFNIQLTGSGDAYIFREGRMLQGKWLRDLVDQPIRLVDPAGSPLALQQGVTFYQVVNLESTIEQNGDNMEFFFFIPPREVTPTPTPQGFVPSPTPTKMKKK
jgi:hypothetical protein